MIHGCPWLSTCDFLASTFGIGDWTLWTHASTAQDLGTQFAGVNAVCKAIGTGAFHAGPWSTMGQHTIAYPSSHLYHQGSWKILAIPPNIHFVRFTLEIGFIWNNYQGVEVYQTEWSYGGSCNGPTNTGIFSCPPRGGIVTMGMFVGCLEWANSLTASRDLSLK